MDARITRHRPQPRHDSNADEYSTIYSTEHTNNDDRSLGSVSQSVTSNTRVVSFRRRAAVAGHCIINSLVITLIVAVAITFLVSICIGLVLLVKPLPSLLQEHTSVMVPNNAIFNDDNNTFSIQYASNRNGSIHTDDDVFIMDRNFPTPQPTCSPTTATPTKHPIKTDIPSSNAPASIVITPAFITSQLTKQTRDGQNTTNKDSASTNSTNVLDSNMKNDTSSKASFTFNDDGKTISNDDPFGNNVPSGNVDDVVAVETPSNMNDVTNTNKEGPCTGSNCNESFMDDVLQNALVTQNVDDTVKGNDGIKASY
jgi:hypothetical protein